MEQEAHVCLSGFKESGTVVQYRQEHGIEAEHRRSHTGNSGLLFLFCNRYITVILDIIRHWLCGKILCSFRLHFFFLEEERFCDSGFTEVVTDGLTSLEETLTTSANQLARSAVLRNILYAQEEDYQAGLEYSMLKLSLVLRN